MAAFDETTHRVLQEHRALKVQQLDALLKEHCVCKPKHTSSMVVRSIGVCEYASEDPMPAKIDEMLWMLDDIHDTLFPSHDELPQRLN